VLEDTASSAHAPALHSHSDAAPSAHGCVLCVSHKLVHLLTDKPLFASAHCCFVFVCLIMLFLLRIASQAFSAVLNSASKITVSDVALITLSSDFAVVTLSITDLSRRQ